MAGSIVTIDSVDWTLDPNELEAGELELPVAGWTDPTYSFPVQGWIVGNGEPVSSVHVRDEYRIRLNLPARLSKPGPSGAAAAQGPDGRGFASRVNALDFPPRFAIKLVAASGGGERSQIATIEGTRRTLPVQADAKFQPIMVTTLGRSGSGWLLSLLRQHPRVTAFQPDANETRFASYFVDVLRTLTRPSSFISALRGEYPPVGDTYWLGKSPVLPLWEYEKEPWNWLGTSYVEELVTLVTRQLDSVYQQLSAREGKDGSTHFVEKCPASGPQVMFSEIYPGAAEILLVRDFRDILCSWHSFGAGPRHQASFPVYEEWIRDLSRIVPAMTDYWRTRSDKVLLVKYEDLVTRTEETLTSIFEHIQIEATPSTVESVIELARKNRNEAFERDHRTSGDAAESIGRWKKELDPALERACEEAFGPALAEFGYAEA